MVLAVECAQHEAWAAAPIAPPIIFPCSLPRPARTSWCSDRPAPAPSRIAPLGSLRLRPATTCTWAAPSALTACTPANRATLQFRTGARAEMKNSLGTIQAVDIRSVWGSESNDFTPWLAEQANITLLAQAVGLDLEVQAQEKRVGAFRADILCKELGSGTQVVIENQLERSDHGHLGQLLTYASGLDTAVIIWLTPKFCEEHRAAIDWLNRITDERFKFFAVQLEVWSISGSLPAPRFTVIAAPNDWNRAVKRAGQEAEVERSESAERRLAYWQVFLSKLRLDDEDIGVPKPNSLGNLRFNLQGRDLWITVYAAASLGRIGVFLRGNAEYYAALVKDRRAIEAQLGESLAWNGDAGEWNIVVRRNANAASEQDWPAQHKWLAEWLEKFIRVFKPYVGKARSA